MRIPWRGVIGLALTVFLLWYAFHDVPWREIRDNLRGVNPWLMGLSVIVSTMVFPLRAIRWRPILEHVAPNLPFGPLWRATAMGFMANNVLPSGRVGEILRPFALSREAPVPFAAGFASLVVDRVFDAVVVLVLTMMALADPAFPSSVSPQALVTGSVLVMCGVAVGLYALLYFPDRFIALFAFVARPISNRLEAKVSELLKTFSSGLNVLRNPRRFLVVLLWAFALWLTQAISFWIAFVSLGVEAPFSAALLVQGFIVLAVAIPGAPGNFGTFETAAITGLALYGVAKPLAVTWAITFHVLSLVPITLIGVYYLARSGMRLADLKRLKT